LIWTLAIALTGCAGIGVWVWSRPDPESLLEQALLLDASDTAECEALLRRAISVKRGRYPDAQLALCCALAQRGAWNEALPLFEACDKAAARSDLLLKFGTLARASAHDAPAIQALEIVRRRIDEWSEPALVQLVAAYQETGRQDEVIDALKEMTSRNPADLRSWWMLIQTLKGSYREAECLDVVREALQQAPPPEFETVLKYRLIEQLLAVGDRDQARTEIAALQSAGDRSVQVSTLLVEILRQEGRLQEALEIANRIFPEVRENPSAYLARGSIYADLGDFAAAIRDLEACVRQQPSNERAHFKLAEAYRLSGKQNQAEQHRALAERLRQTRFELSELLERYSKSPTQDIRDELAALYAELGEETPAQFRKRQSPAAAVPPCATDQGPSLPNE
jgi:tetratricopeptide (TPR) repeat protein